MSKPFWLSHPLASGTPAYGGGPGIAISALTSIEAGDTANTQRYTLPNHVGTHVDAPLHFFASGDAVTDYPPSSWIFASPQMVDVDVGDGELVTPGHLPLPLHDDCDLLLIRTGHEAVRDEEAFWARGPGLSAELGTWLRSERPSVRAVGMDLISVTSRLRREEGRAAHRAFLDPEAEGTPLLLIEDMALAECPTRLTKVLISPLRVLGADGGPVTVWGWE